MTFNSKGISAKNGKETRTFVSSCKIPDIGYIANGKGPLFLDIILHLNNNICSKMLDLQFFTEIIQLHN